MGKVSESGAARTWWASSRPKGSFLSAFSVNDCQEAVRGRILGFMCSFSGFGAEKWGSIAQDLWEPGEGTHAPESEKRGLLAGAGIVKSIENKAFFQGPWIRKNIKNALKMVKFRRNHPLGSS